MRRYRLLLVATIGVLAVLLGVLVFGNLNGNLVYYLTPGEVLAQQAVGAQGRRMQVGGLVRPDSVAQTPEGMTFEISDGTAPDSPAITVLHTGSPAQLFQAGIGVVLEGRWENGRFVSDTMIVKHDANYRAPAAGDRDVRAEAR